MSLDSESLGVTVTESGKLQVRIRALNCPTLSGTLSSSLRSDSNVTYDSTDFQLIRLKSIRLSNALTAVTAVLVLYYRISPPTKKY